MLIDAELELRPIAQQHAYALFWLVNRHRDNLRQWQNWPDSVRTIEDMQAIIQHALRKRKEGTGLDLVVYYCGQPAGKIGFVYIDRKQRCGEIGYWLGQPYQGHGLMLRSCRALVDYGLTQMKLKQINIRCAVDNIASRRIPERLGFIRESRHKTWIHGKIHYEYVYSITLSQWRNRMIYHITSRDAWENAQQNGEYRAPSLDSEGYIHFSQKDQILKVANAIYTGQTDLILLCVDPEQFDTSLRLEPPDGTIPAAFETVELFPHLYQALPVTAVSNVVDFLPNPDGKFSLPKTL